MPIYLGMRIIDSAMEYSVVVVKYPQFKDGVDVYLIEKEREDLIIR